MAKKSKISKNFKDFQFRLKNIGMLCSSDLWWEDIFKHYNFKWQGWWDNYCQGMCFLTSFAGSSSWMNQSIFDKKSENLFIKWLFYGRKRDLKPFYDWFKVTMEKRAEEAKKALEEPKPKEERRGKAGFIYLIKSGNYYKIGRARRLSDRVKSHQTSNPLEVRLVLEKEVDDYLEVERKLLKMFKAKRIKGEWFELSKKDIAAIESLLEPKRLKKIVSRP